MLGQSGSKRKENEVNLTLVDEDEKSNVIGEFDSASFPSIDTLDEDDDDIGEDDLNWYISVICIWLTMVLHDLIRFFVQVINYLDGWFFQLKLTCYESF